MALRDLLAPFRAYPRTATVTGGALLLIAAKFIAPFEGLFTHAYLDPVGIPTICYGHIEGVKLGQKMTKEECGKLLASDLPKYDARMMACIKRPISNNQHIAFLSFSYNVGTGAFCSSTLVRKLNAGDSVGACNQLPRWNRAGGRVLPGLVKRRAAERSLCLKPDGAA
jgi:lysozyme